MTTRTRSRNSCRGPVPHGLGLHPRYSALENLAMIARPSTRMFGSVRDRFTPFAGICFDPCRLHQGLQLSYDVARCGDSCGVSPAERGGYVMDRLELLAECSCSSFPSSCCSLPLHSMSQVYLHPKVNPSLILKAREYSGPFKRAAGLDR